MAAIGSRTVCDDLTASAPTALHQAIDHVATLTLEVQRLRRRLQADIPIDDERLARIEAVIVELTTVLVRCRDGDRDAS